MGFLFCLTTVLIIRLFQLSSWWILWLLPPICSLFYNLMSQFIGVIEAILTSGKQLQNLHVEDDEKIVKSALLRRLICTASSSTIITHAAKLLSCLNKEAAEQRDVLNLFIAYGDQFPEVLDLYSKKFGQMIALYRFIFHNVWFFSHPQVARGHLAVRMEGEKLDSLISQYRKQLGMRNLEFMSVSGATHLIEVILLINSDRTFSSYVKMQNLGSPIIVYAFSWHSFTSIFPQAIDFFFSNHKWLFL